MEINRTKEGEELFNARMNVLWGAKAAGIPVIASGGASRPEHFLEGLIAGAQAVLAAGVFHRHERTIEEIKGYLKKNGMEVRL